MENENDIFSLSELEMDSIFLIWYMYLFDSVMKIYFYTDIIDIYKIDFNEEYKYIYFNILELLDKHQEFKDIKKDFLDQFENLDSLILSHDEIMCLIWDTELFWWSSDYLKTLNKVNNLHFKLRLRYDIKWICDKFKNKTFLSKEDGIDGILVKNTNNLIKRVKDFLDVQNKLYPKLITYWNYISKIYFKLLWVSNPKPLVLPIDDIWITLNKNTWDVKNNWILLWKLSLNTQEYKLFDILLKNKWKFLTYDKIISFIFDNEKHHISKTSPSFIQDLKRKLPKKIKDIIVSEKWWYLIP